MICDSIYLTFLKGQNYRNEEQTSGGQGTQMTPRENDGG